MDSTPRFSRKAVTVSDFEELLQATNIAMPLPFKYQTKDVRAARERKYVIEVKAETFQSRQTYPKSCFNKLPYLENCFPKGSYKRLEQAWNTHERSKMMKRCILEVKKMRRKEYGSS